MYRVITFFIDLQDGEHRYNVGDVFPREGHTVSEERIKELSGYKNKRRTPLIELVKDEPKVEEPAPVAAVKKEKNDRSGSSSAPKAKPRKKK